MRLRFRSSFPAVFALALSFAALLPASSQAATPVEERLGIAGPIRLAGADYALSWSSHPSADLYKQEYLPSGEDPDHYASMVMVDLRAVDANPAQMAAGMIEQLDARKATDAVVNHDLLLKADGSDALLDFLISSEDATSGVVIEWNAYRYTRAYDGRGSQMVGISRRAYGDAAARAFLLDLKQRRVRDIESLAAMTLPVARPSMP